ncbi:hypothetical protein [Streptomyces sp. UNOC14_S4]|nr:hypothetical protein [Streptomyces sp. UNOC14_S4]MCC3766695.1 hypothetical protein [Streptomyces sp. UNOC14_S4]
MSVILRNSGDGNGKLPGEPWPGPEIPPTPDGGPGVPNPPKSFETVGL